MCKAIEQPDQEQFRYKGNTNIRLFVFLYCFGIQRQGVIYL